VGRHNSICCSDSFYGTRQLSVRGTDEWGDNSICCFNSSYGTRQLSVDGLMSEQTITFVVLNPPTVYGNCELRQSSESFCRDFLSLTVQKLLTILNISTFENS
jgi:hypothetical protein